MYRSYFYASKFTYGGFALHIFRLSLVIFLLASTHAWANGLTEIQKNAVRAADEYIKIIGFSRSGLIEQLSGRLGDGYDNFDATVAVDSMNIDWNEQAVRSAKQYLSIQAFSCKGLIEQLSSVYGDKYTLSQAAYGAKQAGAC